MAALARQIVTTAHATTTYAKVTALEAWMGRHVRYSTDIPPLLPGQDAVNQFLFGTRVGYCEQISTALAVMLRTLGVPTREAIGYVPGPFDPLSDLYEIQAKDAHAWVQVWFPGVGLAELRPDGAGAAGAARPGRGAALPTSGTRSPGFPGHRSAPSAAHWRRAPWSLSRRAGAGAGARRAGSRRVTAELERRGAAAGLKRRPAETLGEYAGTARRLGRWRAGPTRPAPCRRVTALLERAAYGGFEPDSRDADASSRRSCAARPARRAGRAGWPPPAHDGVSARASSKLAPRSSRGR